MTRQTLGAKRYQQLLYIVDYETKDEAYQYIRVSV